MPEIAEVRTVAKVLKEQILNKKIIDVIVFYGGILEVEEEYFKNV